MFTKKSPMLLLIGMLASMTLFLFSFSARAQAQGLIQTDGGNQCVVCHENLYYLHDTGKAYCLNDSPMFCVDCHGGDPTTLTDEAAHIGLRVHPIINDDDEKCYECHPAQAEDRSNTFRRVAGVSQLKLAVASEPVLVPVSAGFPTVQPEEWVLTVESASLFFVVGLMLVVFVVHKIRHG